MLRKKGQTESENEFFCPPKKDVPDKYITYLFIENIPPPNFENPSQNVLAPHAYEAPAPSLKKKFHDQWLLVILVD